MKAEMKSADQTQENLQTRLQQALLRDERLAGAAGHLRAQNKGPVNLSGLDDSAKILAALTLAGEAPLLYVVPDILRARRALEDFNALTQKGAAIFYSLPHDFVAAGIKSREAEMERLMLLSSFLQGKTGVLIVPAPVLVELLPPVSAFQAAEIELKKGQNLDREAFLEQLSELAYERCRSIETAGQFAVRGELIDIGLPLLGRGEEGTSEGKVEAELSGKCFGVRLSFFDTEIEDIRLFDTASQRSVRSVETITLPPLREWRVAPDEQRSLAARMREEGEKAVQEILRQGGSRADGTELMRWVEEDASAVEEGLPLAGVARWEPLLFKEEASLLDYGKQLGALLVLDEAFALRSRLDEFEAQFHLEAEELLLKHKIMPFSLSRHRGPADVAKALDRYGHTLTLAQIPSSGNGLPGGITLRVQSHAADQYRGHEKLLFQDLRRWRDEGWSLVLCASGEKRRQRLREVLNEESLTLPVTDLDLSDGFIWRDARLAILGNRNLFGSEKKARRRQRDGAPITLFSDLVPGEYVVHDIHGIGRYLGLESLVNEGVRRDYLHIAYDGEDSLYIPVDKLDEIQKYIAVDGKKPRLSKLGSPEWEKKKARARESIKKLATDLVKVYASRRNETGHSFSPDTVWQEEFEEAFPYTETEDQLRAIGEIKADMESPKVMDRLLCGDVGFGKTEVAFRALFKCVMDGLQGAMLVPTTVLAQQHLDSFTQRLEHFPLRVRLLTRFVSGQKRQEILRDVKNGAVDILIGTHSVLSKELQFRNLGLLVVDEEQRFGVDHKEMLKARYPHVDVLTLTATPIPRTLHMSLSGIRDISLLEEGPEDRRPVQTYVMEYDEGIINEAILREISRGGQVFYLYNDTRKLAGKAAELAERLPGARITYAHGQMSERRLEEAVNGFARGDFDLLVCTTIIESGIDMPNVNTIIVENADRLGLAQLYQIRGRVGRSERQAYAYISYRPDRMLNEDARKRLAAIRDFTELGSGFRIALRDLEVRGAGNLLGGEQSGHLEAIGYDLYCRMLDEEIKEVQGQAETSRLPEEALIDLQVDAWIPADFIEDEGQRMDLYRRALALRTDEDWHEFVDELIDRFGDPPQAVMNLLDIALTRVKAAAAGIERVGRQGDDLIFQLKEDQAANNAFLHLLQNERVAGRLRFSAGRKPFLLLKDGAKPPENMALELRKLFLES